MLTFLLLLLLCIDARLITRVGGAQNLARVRKIKAEYDPANFFFSHPLAGLA